MTAQEIIKARLEKIRREIEIAKAVEIVLQSLLDEMELKQAKTVHVIYGATGGGGGASGGNNIPGSYPSHHEGD